MTIDYVIDEVVVILGTGNADKIEQMTGVVNKNKLEIFGTEFITLSKCSVDTIEECSDNVGNAVEKSLAVYDKLLGDDTFNDDNKLYVIVSEDTSFHLRELNDLPGIYAKRLEKVPELKARPREAGENIYDWMNDVVLNITCDIEKPTAKYSCGFSVIMVYRGKTYAYKDVYNEIYEVMRDVIDGHMGFSYDKICGKNGKPLSTMSHEDYIKYIPRIYGLNLILRDAHNFFINSLD